MDLQVFDSMAQDEKRKSPLIRPFWGTVTEVIESGKKCKVKIDGDTVATDTYYQAINAVNVGNRVLLFYAGEQIVIIGASGISSPNFVTVEELKKELSSYATSKYVGEELLKLSKNTTTSLVCGDSFSVTGNNVCKAIKKGVGTVCILAELVAKENIPVTGTILNIPSELNASLSYGSVPATVSRNGVVTTVNMWNYGGVLKLWSGSILSGDVVSISFNYFI